MNRDDCVLVSLLLNMKHRRCYQNGKCYVKCISVHLVVSASFLGLTLQQIMIVDTMFWPVAGTDLSVIGNEILVL